MDRIVFTGDAFRSYEGECNQINNVRWLHAQFSPLLSSLTGLDCTVRIAGEQDGDRDILRSWYRALGDHPNMEAWARSFWRQAPDELIALMAPDYAGALVISIELSPLMQGVLDRLGVQWIDIGISPIRFLADFAVSFRTSHHFAGRFPEYLRLSSQEVAEGVERIGQFYDQRGRTNLDGSIVFFAQTELDRTLIKSDRIAGPEDAVAGIASIRDGRRIFVKPHPFAPDNPVVAAVLQAFDGEILQANTYEVLSAEEDLIVSTLSSSVGPEAKAFGKSTAIFHSEVQALGESGFTTLRFAKSSRLWASLLGGLVRNAQVGESAWLPNDLRGGLNPYSLDPAIWADWQP